MGNDSIHPSVRTVNPLSRIINILFRPTSEWQIVEAEKTSWWRLYLVYIMPLAALGPLAEIIVLLHPRLYVSSVIGIDFEYDTSILDYLLHIYFRVLIMGYGLVLFASFVLALFINVLAPIVSGKKNLLQALKLVTYASMPIWLARLFFVNENVMFQSRHVPTTLNMILFLIFVIYAGYLLYLGLPVLMKIPQEKRLLYTGGVAGIFAVFAFLVYRETFLGKRVVSLWFQLRTIVRQNQDVANVVLVAVAFVGLAIFFGRRKGRSAE